MGKRRLQILALSAVVVFGLTSTAPAANQRRQQQRRDPLQPVQTIARMLGHGQTVTRTRNALTGAASLIDEVTGGRARAQTRVRQDRSRAVAQQRRMNGILRDRVDALRKLDSYRRMQAR
jgi:hypothetical protein